jgi:hypothetical protein
MGAPVPVRAEDDQVMAAGLRLIGDHRRGLTAAVEGRHSDPGRHEFGCLAKCDLILALGDHRMDRPYPPRQAPRQ